MICNTTVTPFCSLPLSSFLFFIYPRLRFLPLSLSSSPLLSSFPLTLSLSHAGMSYMVSNPALSAVGPHLTSCLEGVVSNHSDTEMGRCMYTHAGVDCRPIAPEYKIRNMFYAREGAKVWPMAMKDGRLQVHMTTTPMLPHLKAVFLHPIKNATEMLFFHQQVRERKRRRGREGEG